MHHILTALIRPSLVVERSQLISRSLIKNLKLVTSEFPKRNKHSGTSQSKDRREINTNSQSHKAFRKAVLERRKNCYDSVC